MHLWVAILRRRLASFSNVWSVPVCVCCVCVCACVHVCVYNIQTDFKKFTKRRKGNKLSLPNRPLTLIHSVA